MNRFAFIGSLVLIAMAHWSAPSSAQTCVSAAHWQHTSDENGAPSHHVWVYVDASLAYDMRTTTNDPYDAGLSYPQVRAAIMQAAEIWNNEARGYRFLYAGEVAIDSPDDFCAATTRRPAVFVHLDTGSTRLAAVAPIPSCPNARHLWFGQAAYDDEASWGIGSAWWEPQLVCERDDP